MTCSGDVFGTSAGRGNQIVRPLSAAALVAGLALAGSVGAQQVSVSVVHVEEATPMVGPLMMHHDQDLSTVRPDFFSVQQPPEQVPFRTRAGAILYSRFAAGAAGGGLWGVGGSPAGSGVQPDILFDEVNIPAARLVDMTTSLPCTVVDINRVKFSVRRTGGSPAGTVTLYWSVFDSRLNPGFLNSTLRTPYDIPPEALHQIDVPIAFPAVAATTTSYFNIGTDTGAALFRVPLHMNTVVIGGVPASLGTFAIGQQIIAPTYTGFQALLTNTGLVGFDGQPTLGDPNVNTFWYYDSDLCTPERTVGYGGTVVAAYTLELFGSPVPSATPTACCLPSATVAVCFVAASADNCLQSNGIVVGPEQGTCTSQPCVQTTCCNTATGACTVVAVANCTLPFLPAGPPNVFTACTPINPCPPLATPANDECSGAVLLSLGVPITDTMAAASRSFPEGTAACGFFTQIDKWYSLTTSAAAPTPGTYRVRAVPQPTSGLNVQQQLVLKSYTNTCPITDQNATFSCFDSSCATGDLTMIIGPDTTILICVQVQSTAASTNFTIRADLVNTRPCCSSLTGLCVLSDATGACNDVAYPNQGDLNTLCTPNPCPRGACCNGAVCSVVGGEPACTGGRLWLGLNSTCAPSNQCAGSCCNAIGVCVIVPRDTFGAGIGCADQNLFSLGGSCNPYPCSNVAPPANDDCAVVLAGANTVDAPAIAATGSTTIMSTLYGATPDLPGASCDDVDNDNGGPGRDVWFRFTPAATGSYGFSLCTGPAALDSVISLFTDCSTPILVCSNPPTCTIQVGICADDNCGTLSRIPAQTLTGGTTYLVRVGVWSLNQAPNNFILQVWINGSCCNINSGACTLTTAGPCGAGTTFQGAASVCTPNPCPATSACCATTGACSVLTAAGCAALAGAIPNAQATCTPNPCPPASACCTATNVCSLLTAVACAALPGTPNAATTCTPTNPCVPVGVCCRGATCSTSATLQSQVLCAASVTGQAGAKFVVSAACGGVNHRVPCCFADYTQNGTRDVSDIFAFLGDWFATRPWSDTDGNTLVQVQDIFAFLTDWFAGGCP